MLRPYNRDAGTRESGVTEEIAFDEMDAVAYRMPGGVAPSDGQCRRRNVGRKKASAGKFFCQSDRDAAGAGADVDYAQTIAGESLFAASTNFSDSQAVEGDFDDVFCFGAGNQHIGSDFKFQAPEFLCASDVLCGFSLGAPQNE